LIYWEAYSAAELIGGLILRDANGAHRTDVTDTAANIIGAISNPFVGLSFLFWIKNTSEFAEEITLTAGSGVTLSHGRVVEIPHEITGQYLAVATNVTSGSEAVTIYPFIK